MGECRVKMAGCVCDRSGLRMLPMLPTVFAVFRLVQDTKLRRCGCPGGVGCKMRSRVSAAEVCLLVQLAGAVAAHAVVFGSGFC